MPRLNYILKVIKIYKGNQLCEVLHFMILSFILNQVHQMTANLKIQTYIDSFVSLGLNFKLFYFQQFFFLQDSGSKRTQPIQKRYFIQLTLEQCGFELYRSTYMQIFFYTGNIFGNFLTTMKQSHQLHQVTIKPSYCCFLVYNA